MSKYYCLFGGHYGSEGKGSLAEYFAREIKLEREKLVVLGENSPNSGHTCSQGKTRNLPASAFYADTVVLGPDSVIHVETLIDDLSAINKSKVGGGYPQIYIHQNAAIMVDHDKSIEQSAGVVSRISSTGSGSGSARHTKQFHRLPGAVIGCHHPPGLVGLVSIVNHNQYMSLVSQLKEDQFGCIFECSQGTLLDINFGTYPYCTSRSTLARVAIERNGLGELPWIYAGVYRTYPIRTGGPSGPTGGKEIHFVDIGQEDEIATVTKRIRRVFEFSREDFLLSLRLNRPDIVAFTHLDYLKLAGSERDRFITWLIKENGIMVEDMQQYGPHTLMLSSEIGSFYASSL